MFNFLHYFIYAYLKMNFHRLCMRLDQYDYVSKVRLWANLFWFGVEFHCNMVVLCFKRWLVISNALLLTKCMLCAYPYRSSPVCTISLFILHFDLMNLFFERDRSLGKPDLMNIWTVYLTFFFFFRYKCTCVHIMLRKPFMYYTWDGSSCFNVIGFASRMVEPSKQTRDVTCMLGVSWNTLIVRAHYCYFR